MKFIYGAISSEAIVSSGKIYSWEILLKRKHYLHHQISNWSVWRNHRINESFGVCRVQIWPLHFLSKEINKNKIKELTENSIYIYIYIYDEINLMQVDRKQFWKYKIQKIKISFYKVVYYDCYNNYRDLINRIFSGILVISRQFVA